MTLSEHESVVFRVIFSVLLTDESGAEEYKDKFAILVVIKYTCFYKAIYFSTVIFGC